MPLNKQKLIGDIKTALDKSQQRKNPQDGRMTLAMELGAAIDAFIKGGDVQTTTSGTGVVAPGIPTAGSPSAQVTVSVGSSTTVGTGVGKVL